MLALRPVGLRSIQTTQHEEPELVSTAVGRDKYLHGSIQ